jgi:mannose-6-phosphate isomerase-like protein (cupin superfamily)
MAGYTIKNLKTEVDNQGTHFGLDENDLQLRMGRVGLECENSGVSYVRYGPNFRQPFGHKHKQQEEIYVLVSGSARVKLEDEVIELDRWSALRVAPGTMRSFEAGDDGAEFIAIGAPNTGPGDGEVVQGWWSD